MRVGIGYDIHRLTEGRPMLLGGVNIPYEKGLLGHSDGDVLLHAVGDAILGALGEEDIGTKFPDDDPRYKNIASSELLREIRYIMDRTGYEVRNLDTVVIAEEPKIRPYRDRIVGSIADILAVPVEYVNVKGKTNEQLGPIGRGEAIAAQAVILLKEI
ncbi:MAG: 2-C-methyl-D-erythritol 2,4-cyclodiphosphate synthase [Candidatus Omnitrophota bacterium]